MDKGYSEISKKFIRKVVFCNSLLNDMEIDQTILENNFQTELPLEMTKKDFKVKIYWLKNQLQKSLYIKKFDLSKKMFFAHREQIDLIV